MISPRNPLFLKRRSDVPLVSLMKAEQILEARHSMATYCARKISFPSAKAISKDNAPGDNEIEFTKTQSCDHGTIEIINDWQNNPFADSPRGACVLLTGKYL